MSSAPAFINRELSWLEFNQRVLNEALRDDLPLLDRVKFLAITDSNLDEFFQVRVGGLIRLQEDDSQARDLTGMTAAEQLHAVEERAAEFCADQYKLLSETLLPALANEGLGLYEVAELKQHQQSNLAKFFEDEIMPTLTPFELDADSGATVPAMKLCVAARLEDEEDGNRRDVFVPLPSHAHRFHHIEDEDSEGYIALEDLLCEHVGRLFPEEKVVGTLVFRVMRNGDIAVSEDESADFADEMEEVLVARKTAETVRLQIGKGGYEKLGTALSELICGRVGRVVEVSGPIGLSDLMAVAFASGRDDLRSKPWQPQVSPDIDPARSLFDTLDDQDVLLLHPYQSFDPVVQMIEQASTDPDVLVIKQVLYRTASRSAIVDALIRAAENGKTVVVLVELKARFDEARNLDRAEDLHRAGVQVVYGVRGLKTHAKITLVVRRQDGRLRRYVHLGTGNYNESTAKLYTDVSYLTSRDSYTADASLFFNAVTGRSKLVRFEKLVPAPTHMRRYLLEMIDAERSRAAEGLPARIMAKVNSLQDEEIIRALYEAAKAGVKIQLNVRGICCLKPGTKGGLKNIEVVSIIDQYLEHPRIMYFHQGGEPEVCIASADWMTRNLDKRVELLTPIEDKHCKRRLIDYLEACFRDNQQASRILPDGSSERIERKKGEKKFRLQAYLQDRAEEAARESLEQRAASFEPHLPAE